MPAELPEVLRARLERRKQVEPRDAPPGPAPSAFVIERDHDHGPMKLLDKSRSHDPNHAGVPTVTRNDNPRRLAQLIRQLTQRRFGFVSHLPLRSAPLSIGPTELLRNLSRPLLILSEK